MRIALVSPLIYASPPRDTGGTERVVADLGNALVALGHDVTVFAANGSRTAGKLVPQGPPISEVEGHPPGYPAAREATMLDAVARQAHRFDVIHAHTEFFHAPVLRHCGVPLVTTIHWRADEADRQHFLQGFADLPVVAISRAQARQMPPSARCMAVVHHGIPANRFTYEDGRGGYVAFLGRMTDQKGPDRAIAAARAAGLPIRLGGDIDVGNPRYFEDKVKPLLSKGAVHLGALSDGQKQVFLGKAVALAFPIDWPEPFGLVMIEAMATGTPVVAMDRGSVREIVEDGVTGFIVERDEDMGPALAKAHELDRHVIRSRFEQRFTAERMARDYAKIYAELAGQS
jgi:glycosyltransferase involved in cell wall biosynthesis